MSRCFGCSLGQTELWGGVWLDGGQVSSLTALGWPGVLRWPGVPRWVRGLWVLFATKKHKRHKGWGRALVGGRRWLGVGVVDGFGLILTGVCFVLLVRFGGRPLIDAGELEAVGFGVWKLAIFVIVRS